MTFPGTPATIVIMMAFGADVTADPSTWTWTDVTSDWETEEELTATDGQSEGATQAEASEATYTLRSDDSRYMPDDARSPHWPHVDIGTPVRITIDAGSGAYTLVESFISALRPEWPGKSRYLCWIRVTARGILDRLGRGQSPLRLPLERAILGAQPAAYWRLDDGTDAVQCASGLPGGTPMAITGVPDMGATDGPSGAPGKYVRIRAADANLGMLFAPVSMTDVDYWEVEVWASCINTAIYSSVEFLGWTTTGTQSRWTLTAGYDPVDDEMRFAVWYSYGTGLYGGRYIDLPADRDWHHIRVRCHIVGPDMICDFYIDDASNLGGGYTATTVGTIVEIKTGPSLLIENPGITDISLAHLALYNTVTADHGDAGTGFVGETASARITRLCAEEGVRLAIAAGDSEPMGPQPSATFLDLLRECEAADSGRLGEYDFGLAYRPRSALYNQATAFTLDGAQAQVAEPFAPAKDLQRRRNEWKIIRKDGSSAVYADTTDQQTRGRLDDSATPNVLTDGVLIHHAAWRVGLGITPGMRYPSLSVDLGRHPDLIAAWTALGLGDRVQAADLVYQHPRDPVDQLVEGRVQALHGRTGWTVTLVTSPARPYTVFVVEGAGNLGRLDMSPSILTTGVDADDVTLTVATSSGPLLTTTATYPTDFPFDASLGGERVTVTAITGATSPQTVTVTRAINSVVKSHLAGAELTVWLPGQIAL